MNDVWADTQSSLLGGLRQDGERSPLLDAKVMMVDDEPLMTDLVQALLEDEGYANFIALHDPRQALALMRREEPSVLLLDLMMPQMSGFDLLAAIRADKATRYTPVIVLTASAGAESKLRALHLGATDFLSKPVDGSELVLRVRNALAFFQYNNRLLNYDAATGLPNQRLFDRGIDEMLSNQGLAGGLVALMSVMVPDCRILRDSVDQATADSFVKALSRRLHRFAHADHLMPALATGVERAPRVARMGVDHFCLLFEAVANVEAVEALARRVLDIVAEPMNLGFQELVSNAWIGISLAPVDGSTAAALRKSSDLAVTHAAQQGLVRYMFSTPELNARSLQRLHLGAQLRGAADRGELRVHYQPKVDISSGRIIGAEALVRWQHPQRGMVPPNEFIALAEELDLISGIGRWVMDRACRDTVAWFEAGLGRLKVAVNVSRSQLFAGDLCQTIARILTESGLPGDQLVLEITESLLMDDTDRGQRLMLEVKALGVNLSIDDFGTGYSSLACLKNFPLDELKVDQSFVADLPGSSSDVALVHTIIDLGHRLGMSVIAEGVENPEQLTCLSLLGCDRFQGYLISKPIPADLFVELLRQENAKFGAPVASGH